MTEYKYFIDLSVDGVYGIVDDSEHEPELDEEFIEDELKSRLKDDMESKDSKSDMNYNVDITIKEVDKEDE